MTPNRNDLAYWFPLIKDAGLPVPRTFITHTDADLIDVLDGETPAGWDALIADLAAAGDNMGWPCFLRTGHGSGKHSWANTCHVPGRRALAHHVGALVEWSALVDLMGLPTSTWVIRELLDTQPLFRCAGYDMFPVTREFRLFVRDDTVEHIQPYWPPDAVEEGRPDHPDWRRLLEDASHLQAPARGNERLILELLALRASHAVGGGHWSVDLLQDRAGAWWLTDMADGDQSFKWTDPYL